MFMLADFVQLGGMAKARHILIPFALLPGMEGIGDFLDVVRGEVAQYAVFHVAHLAGVDKQGLTAPVAFLLVQREAVLLVAGQEPDAGGNLGIGEQLAGQRDHAFHVVVFDQPLADFAFVVGVGTHGAVGQQQRHAAGGRQVPEHVLQPGEVGVALWRRAGDPAWVAGQLFVPPFLHVEGRVGHDEVGAQVRVQVVQQGVGRATAEVEVDAADGHVHRGQPPGGGVALLPVDADLPGRFFALAVGGFATVLLDELFALHEEAAGAHGRVVHAALERLEHFHDQGDDALGRVVLAALLAFGQGELAEEVFVDVAEDVLGFQVQRLALVFAGSEVGIREVTDQPGQLAGIELHTGEVLVEHVLQAGILALDGFHGVVDQPADRAHFLRFVLAGLVPRQRRFGRQLRAIAQGLPAGLHWHPEHVLLGVVVADFQLGGDVFFVLLRTRAAVFGRVHVIVVLRVGELFAQFALPFFEGVGDVLEEDQPEHDVLVHGGIEVGAQLVGSSPELLFQVVEELLFDGSHVFVPYCVMLVFLAGLVGLPLDGRWVFRFPVVVNLLAARYPQYSAS